MLSVRSLTVREIRDRLARRGHGAGEVDEAVASLLARGYLDDRALAYNVATSRASRLYGPARVAAELKRRGIAAEAVREAVRRVFDEVDEDDLARNAAAKLAGAVRAPAGDGGTRARLARALLRRGFSGGAVAKALGPGRNRGHGRADETADPGQEDERGERARPGGGQGSNRSADAPVPGWEDGTSRDDDTELETDP